MDVQKELSAKNFFLQESKTLSEMDKKFIFEKQCRLKIWVLFEWSFGKKYIENFAFFFNLLTITLELVLVPMAKTF